MRVIDKPFYLQIISIWITVTKKSMCWDLFKKRQQFLLLTHYPYMLNRGKMYMPSSAINHVATTADPLSNYHMEFVNKAQYQYLFKSYDSIQKHVKQILVIFLSVRFSPAYVQVHCLEIPVLCTLIDWILLLLSRHFLRHRSSFSSISSMVLIHIILYFPWLVQIFSIFLASNWERKKCFLLTTSWAFRSSLQTVNAKMICLALITLN